MFDVTVNSHHVWIVKQSDRTFSGQKILGKHIDNTVADHVENARKDESTTSWAAVTGPTIRSETEQSQNHVTWNDHNYPSSQPLRPRICRVTDRWTGGRMDRDGFVWGAAHTDN